MLEKRIDVFGIAIARHCPVLDGLEGDPRSATLPHHLSDDQLNSSVP